MTFVSKLFLHRSVASMATNIISSIPIHISIFLILLCLCVSMSSCLGGNKQLYIVYMGTLPDGTYSPESHHIDILQSVIKDFSSQTLYRSYHRSFNGFAAWLSEQEQEKLSKKGEVLSIFPSRTLQLQTTRSWDFLGFSENVTRDPKIESETIIGVLDTGIWPESESFSDAGFGPAPEWWKGVCNGGPNFTCNGKIIGARFYGSNTNALDDDGHGTHTASTAAGNVVQAAGFFNIAQGTARGGVPSSRIAVYKICSLTGCESADMLAGFDDAIADGVDVITISVNNLESISLEEDVIAIGSFHAMANNIVTVNSAGNAGDDGASTIYNLAPWMITVGASTTDRKIIDKIVLGDGKTVIGKSINTFSIGAEPKYPLVYGKVFNSSCSEDAIKSCADPSCFDKDSVKGTIVMCNNFAAEFTPNDLEISGVISFDDLTKDVTVTTLSSQVLLEQPEFDQVATFAASTAPKATILTSETVKDPLAPLVAAFSSRGPNSLIPEIMKPNVVAPGVNILAAYPPYISPTKEEADKRSSKYNIISGTSMACPHVAGVVAYLKTLHPAWSPSVLQSAIMTTARPLNASLHPDREFAYGAGLIDPLKAVNPGLVYDITKQDYIDLLCSAYDNAVCSKFTGEDCKCLNIGPLTDFNYPALTAKIDRPNINVNFTRVVTNLGDPKSTYKAQLTADPNLKIAVVPDTLSFNKLGETKTFEVSVTGSLPEKDKMLSSEIVWSDGTHSVRSPIVVFTDT